MRNRLIETIDDLIQEILNEDPVTVKDIDGYTVVTCSDGPAVAFKVKKDSTTNTVHVDYNDKRGSNQCAWHGDIRMYSPGLEVLRGRFWSREKIGSFYQKEEIVAPYRKEIEKFFEDLGEDIRSYKWDFDDSSQKEGFKQWPWQKDEDEVEAPKDVGIPPEIQDKINQLLPQFHLAPPGAEKEALKAEIDDLYKQAGVINQREKEEKAKRKAVRVKKIPYEKGGGGTMAGYTGKLPALEEDVINEDPDYMIDKISGLKLGVSDGPAIAFFCLVDPKINKHKWFYYRSNHDAAWHMYIRVTATADFPEPYGLNERYLRGRIWTDHKVCSFYDRLENFKPLEVQRVQELFDILGLNIKDFKFEFNFSARTIGLVPWPFPTISDTEPEKEKEEISPEEQAKIDRINARITELQATLHLKVGQEREEIEKQIEELEKEIGKVGGIASKKTALRKAYSKKLLPYEKGGEGSVAGYSGKLPALQEGKVRIYNKNLCPKLWDQNKKLNPEVRSTLLKIAFDFYVNTGLQIKIQDVYLLGSAANYNWTPESDLDVHILVDGSAVSMQKDNVEKFFRSMVGKWNLEHDIVVKGHPVELYLQDIHEKNSATSIYSLVNDRWIKEPSPKNISVDKTAIQKKYTLWVQKIENAIANNDNEKLMKILENLREYRKAGLAANGEFSTENIVFKILRTRGYLDKLKKFANDIYDKKMTVKDGYDPTSQGPNPSAGISPDMNNGNFYKKLNRQMKNSEAVKEGYGSGVPGGDPRLGIPGEHWRIKWQSAGKTPKMPSK